MEISPLLIPISAIVGAFIMIILLRKFENDERMAMIEKGLNPHMPKPRRPKTNSMITFHFAAISIGVSLGLLIGYLLESVFNMFAPVAYFSMILLFGGIGLLVSYAVQFNHEEREREREREQEIKAEKHYSDDI
jgi:hypothetical protein